MIAVLDTSAAVEVVLNLHLQVRVVPRSQQLQYAHLDLLLPLHFHSIHSSITHSVEHGFKFLFPLFFPVGREIGILRHKVASRFLSLRFVPPFFDVISLACNK